MEKYAKLSLNYPCYPILSGALTVASPESVPIDIVFFRFQKTIQFNNKLPQYQVPDNLRQAVLDHEDLCEAFLVLNEVSDDGVEAETRKSQCCFQIIQYVRLAEHKTKII